MRVAAIDIGTNTILMLIAEERDGTLVQVRDEMTIVRLGEDVDRTRALKPEAIARARACLERYATIAHEEAVDRIGVVGTSAMRDAGGGEEVRAIVRDLFGVDARTISGEEEARLTFRGGTSGLDLHGTICVVDIGGGSTEIVIGRGGSISFARSFDIGSVRLTERFVHHDPATAEELANVKQHVAATLAELAPLRDATLVGIAGTMTTLAAVELGLVPYDGARVHGHAMTREAVAAVVDRLAALPLDRRKAVPGLEPKRADVIVQGGWIALGVMDRLAVSSLRISDRGVRWGVAEELARPSSSQNI